MAKTAKKAKEVSDIEENALPATPPSAGHNSGEKNDALIGFFEEYEAMDENKKQIGKAQRDIKAKVKEQFGIPIENFSHEVKMRKKEQATRRIFEETAKDIQGMLGYQFALDVNAEAEEPESDADAVADRVAGKAEALRH